MKMADATQDNLLLIDKLQEASSSGNLSRLIRDIESIEYCQDQLASLINQNVDGQNVLGKLLFIFSQSQSCSEKKSRNLF